MEKSTQSLTQSTEYVAGLEKEVQSKQSSIGQWFDARTGFGHLAHLIFTWPVPKYVQGNLLYALGGLTLISLLFQMFTGLNLTLYYDPSPEVAYDSVDYVTYQAPLGWLIRGIHHYNASAIVILVFLHMLRTFFHSTYKKPRELTWLSGVLLLLITLGFGFTGYLLPWDQRGYWATTVGTEIAGKTPGIGEYLMRLMRGGTLVGQLTLTRFYVMHVAILPTALVLLTLFHLFQHRYHGVAPAITKRGQEKARLFVPYCPNWAVMDAVLGLGLLAVLVFLSWTAPAPLEFPANPASTDYLPRPEWYFLFLFQMLNYVPGNLEPWFIVLVPTVVIGSMILLPFLDNGEERRPWHKPLTTIIALFYIVVLIVFTLLAL